MHHYVIHARTRTRTLTAILLRNHYITCSIAFGLTPIPMSMYDLSCCFTCKTCCFVVFIVVSFHTLIQSFSFITCPISQLCAQTCPYYNVWPGAVYCCFNKNYNILNMTLLVNPTCLQSFVGLVFFGLWDTRVESKKEKEKKMKNFETYRGVGIFLTPFPCSYLHHFLVTGVI